MTASERGARARLAGQGVRFALSGGAVALVYIATTTLLAEVIGIPFELALAIGFSLAIATHFTLQRVFVWVHAEGFALPIRRQAMRYLPIAGIQYGLTASESGPRSSTCALRRCSRRSTSSSSGRGCSIRPGGREGSGRGVVRAGRGVVRDPAGGS